MYIITVCITLQSAEITKILHKAKGHGKIHLIMLKIFSDKYF